MFYSDVEFRFYTHKVFITFILLDSQCPIGFGLPQNWTPGPNPLANVDPHGSTFVSGFGSPSWFRTPCKNSRYQVASTENLAILYINQRNDLSIFSLASKLFLLGFRTREL